MRLGGWPVVRKLAVLCAGAFVTGAALVAACTDWNDATVTFLGDGGEAVTTEGGTEAEPAAADGSPEASCSAPLAYLPMADAARLCSLTFQCSALATSLIASTEVPIDPTNYSLCMNWAAGPVAPSRVGFSIQQAELQCAAKTTTCEGAGACLSLEVLAPNDARCTGMPDGGGCLDDGGSALWCGNSQLWHCNNAQFTQGATCQNAGGGVYLCGLATPCPPAPQCRTGNFLDTCGGPAGPHLVLSCTTLGSACNPMWDDAGNPGCGNACNFLGPSCGANGNVVVCDLLESSEFDCAGVCGKCVSGGGAIYCARPSDACTPSDPTMNQCTGTSISLCIGGQPTMFNCSDIGKACVPGMAPQTAHCG